MSTNANCARGSSVCGKGADYTSYGLLESQKMSELLLNEFGKGDGVSISYVGADTCNGNEKYKSTIHVICSEAVGSGYIYKIDDNICDLIMYAYSEAGCPTVSKKAAVSACGIILIM